MDLRNDRQTRTRLVMRLFQSFSFERTMHLNQHTSIRLNPVLSMFCALLCCTTFSAQADTQNDRDIHCAAYYEILSVAGDQPDISRKQSSQGFYALLKHAGDTPEAQENVAQKMVELSKETPGPMTPASTARLREKYDAECRILLKAAWCEAYADSAACKD